MYDGPRGLVVTECVSRFGGLEFDSRLIQVKEVGTMSLNVCFFIHLAENVAKHTITREKS